MLSECTCLQKRNGGVCQLSRFKKCESALRFKTARLNSLENTEAPAAKRVNYKEIPCSVCGCPSSGFCYGAFTCEGCKIFFRRSVRKDFKHQYLCRSGKDDHCPINSKCRKCRLERCLKAGMKSKSSRKKPIKSFGGRQIIKTKNRGRVTRSSVRSENNGAELSGSTSALKDSAGPSIDSDRSQSDSGCLDVTGAQGSSSILKRLVTAAAYLNPISDDKVVFSFSMSRGEILERRSKSFEIYLKAIGDFVKALPGIDEIHQEDKVVLLTTAFFPLSIAQLSLQFNKITREVNHFGMQPGETLAVGRSMAPINYDRTCAYFEDAGDSLTSSIFNIEEFGLFCSLLVLNPEIPELQEAQRVRNVRLCYEIELYRYLSEAGNGAENRLSQIYKALIFFRTATPIMHDLFNEIKAVNYGVDFHVLAAGVSPLISDFSFRFFDRPLP